MFFTLLILALLFFLVIRPLWRGYGLYRRWRNATADLRDSFAQYQRQAAAQQPPEPPRKKKKIDPAVGEYVAFEEISASASVRTESDSKGTHTSVRVESQIEDAVWEEIK